MGIKVSLGVTIGLMALTAAAVFVVTDEMAFRRFNEKVRSVSEKQEFYTKLSETDSVVRNNYVGEIDEKNLIDRIISGYMNGLDDIYASYYTADEYAALDRSRTGILIGLGFDWEKDPTGYIRITNIHSGSPAEEYGLSAGDTVMAVNNINVISYPGGYPEAVKNFTADEGVKVKLSIKRINAEGATEFFNTDIISARTIVNSVDSVLRGNIGCIRISEFNGMTAGQVSSAVEKLQNSGADRFIFDVRNNSCGTIEALKDVLEVILPAGDIVTAYYRGRTETLIAAENDEDRLDCPIAVIVNSGTKGEAELFASALRDECGAAVVGRNTYGKGVLQEIYKLSDGSAVEFSSAVVCTRNSGDFTERGIKPDYDVMLSAGTDPFRLTAAEQELYDTQLLKAEEVVSAG